MRLVIQVREGVRFDVQAGWVWEGASVVAFVLVAFYPGDVVWRAVWAELFYSVVEVEVVEGKFCEVREICLVCSVDGFLVIAVVGHRRLVRSWFPFVNCCHKDVASQYAFGFHAV